MLSDRIQSLDVFYLESICERRLDPMLECGLCNSFCCVGWVPAFQHG